MPHSRTAANLQRTTRSGFWASRHGRRAWTDCRPREDRRIRDGKVLQGRGAKADRGACRSVQNLLKTSISTNLRERADEYSVLVKSRYINRQESSEIVLKEQKVIGMTTTGLSKYRGLVSALQPRVVLIEEAAETTPSWPERKEKLIWLLTGLPRSMSKLVVFQVQQVVGLALGGEKTKKGCTRSRKRRPAQGKEKEDSIEIAEY